MDNQGFSGFRKKGFPQGKWLAWHFRVSINPWGMVMDWVQSRALREGQKMEQASMGQPISMAFPSQIDGERKYCSGIIFLYWWSHDSNCNMYHFPVIRFFTCFRRTQLVSLFVGNRRADQDHIPCPMHSSLHTPPPPTSPTRIYAQNRIPSAHMPDTR